MKNIEWFISMQIYFARWIIIGFDQIIEKINPLNYLYKSNFAKKKFKEKGLNEPISYVQYASYGIKIAIGSMELSIIDLASEEAYSPTQNIYSLTGKYIGNAFYKIEKTGTTILNFGSGIKLKITQIFNLVPKSESFNIVYEIPWNSEWDRAGFSIGYGPYRTNITF